MKKKKKKTLDTLLIESVEDKSLIYPNCASLLKQQVPIFPDFNTNDFND